MTCQQFSTPLLGFAGCILGLAQQVQAALQHQLPVLRTPAAAVFHVAALVCWLLRCVVCLAAHLVHHVGQHGIQHTRVHGRGGLHVQVHGSATKPDALHLDGSCITTSSTTARRSQSGTRHGDTDSGPFCCTHQGAMQLQAAALNALWKEY